MTHKLLAAVLVSVGVTAMPLFLSAQDQPLASSLATANAPAAATTTPTTATSPAETTTPATATSPAAATTPSSATLPTATTTHSNAATAAGANDIRSTEDAAALYQIGPEDVLDISVWKNPELSRTVPVRPDGKVSLPLVNDIQAAGLTPTDLRDQVTTRLSEYVPAPEVSVMVREVHSRKVAVVGAVKTPGRFEVKSPATVLEMIAMAQGLTDFASRDRIVVLRQSGGTTTRIPFNYSKISDGAKQENFFVRPGDIIVVP